ncbi:MAG: hypothetical protein HY896_03140 [Deltaproteobacteria bacterium]|nr:hypothetical protein [Deltaproteobacteria bacterium]
MNRGTDTLLADLLELARAQRAALGEGKLEEAMELAEERRVIVEGISIFERGSPVRPAAGKMAVGSAGGRVCSRENRRKAIGEILSVDRDISEAIRAAMSDTAAKLDGIDKLKRYFRNTAARGTAGKISVTA